MKKDINEIKDLIIGMSYDDAKKICDENNIWLRMTMRDGERFIITMDLRMDRLNVHIENDLIVKSKIG